MIRVHVICEGQTEEMFVNQVLYHAFDASKLTLVPALIGRPGHKGGHVNFDRLLVDVKNRLLGDKTAWCTTFFDYYGLPTSFPGREAASVKGSVAEKAKCITDAMTEKMREAFGDEAMRRFIPYVQMYEFEGLLFSAPEKLASGIGRPDLAGQFGKIRQAFDTPECINNSPQTAPSKRIIGQVEGYEKPLHGALAALEIGIASIRAECAGFDRWVSKMEALPL